MFELLFSPACLKLNMTVMVLDRALRRIREVVFSLCVMLIREPHSLYYLDKLSHHCSIIGISLVFAHLCDCHLYLISHGFVQILWQPI